MVTLFHASDETTDDPFTARLSFGMWILMDKALPSMYAREQLDERKADFEKLYDPVMGAMRAARTSAATINRVIDLHRTRLKTGEIVVRSGPQSLTIMSGIDQQLQSETVAFFIHAVIAMKNTQHVVKLFGPNIGCLFQREPNFIPGIQALETSGHVPFAAYLRAVRANWSEKLISKRNNIEHEGWHLPRGKPGIVPETKTFQYEEPNIDGSPISQYCAVTWNRVVSFVENTIVYAVSQKLPRPFVFVEIPREQRDPNFPARFRIGIKKMEPEQWEISYCENDFP